jgi:hypothetical protein
MSGGVPALAPSVDRLETYIEAERYRGYDPYDGLTSPLFRAPVLRSSKLIRLAAIQAVKRSPINVRPLLGIPKQLNPVTLALALEGSAYRALAAPEDAERHAARGRELVDELRRVQTPGWSGACWGYPFDWEARYGRLPAGTPTIVATGLVTNALFIAHRVFGLEDALELCVSAARYVLEDLPRTTEDGTFCWGYFHGDRQRVLNATMKGARLCAQLYSATGDASYLEPASQTTAYVARHQRADGSWPYAVGDARRWADNFHTAYVLDALDTYEECSGDGSFAEAMGKGWRYYRKSFFRDDRVPTYYPDPRSRSDATACGQSLLTLCRFDDVETATNVAMWAVETMQCADGHFAYQVRGRRVVRIPYMRWSSAYMYAGLSRVLLARSPG